MEMELAWHFLAEDAKHRPILRDGSRLVVGKWYEHTGPLVMCSAGYHASTLALDALQYAPGQWVSLVEVDGTIERGDDKLVCTRRRALWAYDATEQLRLFARNCALNVANLWEMPAIVREYLETGKEEIRGAAGAAAWAAAWDASRAAAWAAARASARAAARAAAWDAARDAAGDASGDHQNATLESLLWAGVSNG
jgi:hypothetical protein